ncbi:MAG TPA: redoxin domain-containing protein [Chryseosolibacter sp.]
MKTIFAIALSLLSVITFGQQLAGFKLVNVMNDQEVSADTYPSCSGLVIIFTSNTCPYDEYYRGRIAKLASSYTDKVPVLLVNSQPDPAESKENMQKKAKQANFSFPYLEDKNQTLMTALDAKKTSEAFLLKNEGGKFVVVYRGAIDDNAQVEADVRHNYLRDAIDIMLANQKIETAEVRPVGCNLKKK